MRAVSVTWASLGVASAALVAQLTALYMVIQLRRVIQEVSRARVEAQQVRHDVEGNAL